MSKSMNLCKNTTIYFICKNTTINYLEFIKKIQNKKRRNKKPKQMATFLALGGIATASWFERESFFVGLI